MDELDRRILDILRQNARIPVKDIARQVSLTSPAVSSRIHRMEQDGVIAGYTVVLDPPHSGTTVDALISVSIPPSLRQDFMQELEHLTCVLQCFHVTGSHSYIVKARCSDMDALEHLITIFQRMGQTSTQIILSTPVDRTHSFL